jgi:uncharacterized cupin superfamily protein
MHWHTREEELFVVLSGTPTLRTPRGTAKLRPGDCIAFRTDPGGAHRLENHADEDALVLLIANTDRGDVCYYPRLAEVRRRSDRDARARAPAARLLPR